VPVSVSNGNEYDDLIGSSDQIKHHVKNESYDMGSKPLNLEIPNLKELNQPGTLRHQSPLKIRCTDFIPEGSL
jgi:hypothetical protein